MECPSCGAENAATRKFCRACGVGLAPACPACNAPNDPGDRFCGECGASLESAPGSGGAAVPGRLAGTEARPTGEIAPPDAAEERRPVTILFADLVGFTSLSERLDSEDVREITTECLRRLVTEIARYEGTVDKFMGDAVMALFGAPVAHEDDPARALRAALDMQAALARFNDELERERGFRLALRIGIETGEVVAGLRDVGGVREYTVIGDAVNVAARLQAATEPGTILVGEVTRQRTASLFTFRPVPPLSLKGKEQPVAAAILAAVASAEGSALNVATSPLVERAEELHALEGCVVEVRRGRGQIAMIVGEPGLGKSRLLAELRARASDLRWCRCPAFAHEQALAYGVARTLVRALAELDPDLPDAEAGRRLRAYLATLGCSPHHLALAHLLTLPLEPDEAREMAAVPPQELQRLTFQAVAALLGRAGEQAPLVLELDDLHWADPSSIDLLRELLEVAERAPVFFCCALRPERDAPAWGLRERAARDLPHRCTELVLRPLSDRASGELARRLLGLDELPDGLRPILERAAGTPLWVEELVRTLVERGLLVDAGGRWGVAADLADVEIPESLQALIVARIDRLGEARPTLQTASVIGRRFGRRVLDRIAGARPELDDHLVRAQRADLVRELAAIPEREYGFKHVLTQEAAYATLLVRRRRELHRQVAEALEALYPERLDELHAVLAHHYERAEAWGKAVEHAAAAADAARGDYANREALEQYGRALAAADRADVDISVKLALHEARAGVHQMLGQFEPARADFEQALALAGEVDGAADRARLLGALGMLWGGHRDYQRGLELTRQATAAAEQSGDRRAVAEARTQVGVILLNLSQMRESRRELEAALAHFRKLGDEVGQARTLDVLAMATFCAGDLHESADYCREALPRLNGLGDRSTEGSTMNTLGLALGYLGEWTSALDWFQRSRAVWEEMEARSGLAYTDWCIAEVGETFGAFELAFREASAGLAIAREIGHREWIVGGLSSLGRVRRLLGDPIGARSLHEEMLATARELGTTLWIAQALSDVGEDLLAMGEEPAALVHLEEAIAVGGDAGKFVVRALLARADLHLRFGRPTEALGAARNLQSTTPEFVVFVAESRCVEGEALAALGRESEAEAPLRRAKSEALALGAAPARWRACLALADLFERTDGSAEAAAERADARAALEAVAAELSDPHLRRSFEGSEPFRRARR